MNIKHLCFISSSVLGSCFSRSNLALWLFWFELFLLFQLNLNFNASSDSICDESKQATSNQPCQSMDPTPEKIPTTSPIQIVLGNSMQSGATKPHEINPVEEGGFFLPDLNMIPAEDCLWGSHSMSWRHVSAHQGRCFRDITTYSDVKWRMIWLEVVLAEGFAHMIDQSFGNLVGFKSNLESW